MTPPKKDHIDCRVRDISSACRYYWKLDCHFHGEQTIEYYQDRFTVTGRYFPSDAMKERLLDLLARAERGLVMYDACREAELSVFVTSRGLTARVPALAEKADLVEALEAADDSATFRFMELPPELRVRVCESHVAALEFVDFADWGVQPPITGVSKVARKEALPVYYRNTFFYMNVELGEIFDDDAPGGSYPALRPCLPRETKLFWNALSDEHLSDIRNIALTLGDDYWGTRSFVIRLPIEGEREGSVQWEIGTDLPRINYPATTVRLKLLIDEISSRPGGPCKLRRDDIDRIRVACDQTEIYDQSLERRPEEYL